jgi:hypothetical protein
MRWYNITFTRKPGTPVNPNLPLIYSSIDTFGYNNAGALEVDFDIINASGRFIGKSSHLRIHNVPLSICQQAQNYQGLEVQISGGFLSGPSNGFQLARQKQSGVLGFGIVQACIPNYMGTELVMDFVIIPSAAGSPELDLSDIAISNAPKSYVFNWKKGQGFIEAVTTTFKTLNIKVRGTVSDKVKNNSTEVDITWVGGSYNQFCMFINDRTRNLVQPNTPREQQTYTGVEITFIAKDTILVYDNTIGSGVIKLEADEFIGQPSVFTPIGLQVQSIHPLRADILVSGYVQYPNISTLVGALPVAGTQNKPITASNKRLWVNQVRHIGRFRDTSAQGWATYVTAGSVLEPIGT